jgi:hypothetical protein
MSFTETLDKTFVWISVGIRHRSMLLDLINCQRVEVRRSKRLYSLRQARAIGLLILAFLCGGLLIGLTLYFLIGLPCSHYYLFILGLVSLVCYFLARFLFHKDNIKVQFCSSLGVKVMQLNDQLDQSNENLIASLNLLLAELSQLPPSKRATILKGNIDDILQNGLYLPPNIVSLLENWDCKYAKEKDVEVAFMLVDCQLACLMKSYKWMHENEVQIIQEAG